MKPIRLLVLLLLLSPMVFAQGARFDNFTFTAQSNKVLTAIPSPVVTVCSYPGTGGIPCTNLATTYTDASLSTPCTAPAQVVLQGSNVCSIQGDTLGNFGFWVAAGNYTYCLSGTGVTAGCYNITVGSSGNPAVARSRYFFANDVTTLPGGALAMSSASTVNPIQSFLISNWFFGAPDPTGLNTAAIHTAGSGYAAFDIVNVTAGTGGSAQILTVGGGGVPTSVRAFVAGTGYTNASNVSTTGGSGSGLTLDITTCASTCVGGTGSNDRYNVGGGSSMLLFSVTDSPSEGFVPGELSVQMAPAGNPGDHIVWNEKMRFSPTASGRGTSIFDKVSIGGDTGPAGLNKLTLFSKTAESSSALAFVTGTVPASSTLDAGRLRCGMTGAGYGTAFCSLETATGAGTYEQALVAENQGDVRFPGNVSTGSTYTFNSTAVGPFTQLILNGVVTTPRVIKFQTSGVDRWVVKTDDAAETGASAGSNFAIVPINDAGTSLDPALTITRASKLVSVGNLHVTSGTAGVPAASGTLTNLTISIGSGGLIVFTVASTSTIAPVGSFAPGTEGGGGGAPCVGNTSYAGTYSLHVISTTSYYIVPTGSEPAGCGATVAGTVTIGGAGAGTPFQFLSGISSGQTGNSDLAGQLTVGGGGTITYTFANTYATAPICVSSDTNAAPAANGASASTTTLTITGTAGHVVNYICVGRT